MNTKQFTEIVNANYGLLKQLKSSEVTQRPKPDKWSKKEILGHLCDSAINNYYRFLHLQNENESFKVKSYNQRMWVTTGNYQNRDWDEILSLWFLLNQSLIQVISNALEAHLDTPVQIGTEYKSYSFLIYDYFEHLNHHLNQILESCSK